MSEESRPVIEPTRWEGVSHEKIYRDLVNEPAAGAIRNTTESLRASASALEANQDLLREAVQLTSRALDDITATGSGPAADARARSVAALLIWLRELVDGSAALPPVISGAADHFDNASTKVRPPERPARYDEPDVRLYWVHGPTAEDREADAAEARHAARDQMLRYESAANGLLLGMPAFAAPKLV